MILADTSVWMDHFRLGVARFAARLGAGEILIHPFVLGELLLGGVGRSPDILADLRALPKATLAHCDEVDLLIQAEALHGRGIGYVDSALLASVRLQGARLWTHDRRLSAVADSLSVGLGGLG